MIVRRRRSLIAITKAPVRDETCLTEFAERIGEDCAGVRPTARLLEHCAMLLQHDEMDCDAEDIALTIHAHPTLHESVGMAAEIYEGSITDLPNAKAKKSK